MRSWRGWTGALNGFGDTGLWAPGDGRGSETVASIPAGVFPGAVKHPAPDSVAAVSSRQRLAEFDSSWRPATRLDGVPDPAVLFLAAEQLTQLANAYIAEPRAADFG